MSPLLLSRSAERKRRCTVAIEGVVQGVGFRPFVYRLARRHGLRGSVRNGRGGVLIEAEGDEDRLARFRVRYTSPQEVRAMSPAQAKPTPNWCPQVNPDEPWTGRCMKEKIAEDGKRHRCHKKEQHDEPVHGCKCSLEWKQF